MYARCLHAEKRSRWLDRFLCYGIRHNVFLWRYDIVQLRYRLVFDRFVAMRVVTCAAAERALGPSLLKPSLVRPRNKTDTAVDTVTTTVTLTVFRPSRHLSCPPSAHLF